MKQDTTTDKLPVEGAGPSPGAEAELNPLASDSPSANLDPALVSQYHA